MRKNIRMKRYELTKEQWERVKQVLPPERTGKRGRPRKDDRTITGCAGSSEVVHNGGGKIADKAVGRTRGGLNTKLHTIVDGLGNPVTFLLSAGNVHDSTHAIQLLEQVNISRSSILADRAYGAASIRTYIGEHGASYVIPPKSNVSDPWAVDWHLYKERHLVEYFFQKIKWFRRIATKYDQLDASFLAFVYLAAIAILLI